MIHGLLADIVLIVHLLFILFVAFGGLLLLWRRWIMWVHLPVVAYGILIEWVGWICPLTPLENALRATAGEAGYAGGFVENYLVPLIYPPGYAQELAWLLGGLVLVANVLIYALCLSLTRRR